MIKIAFRFDDPSVTSDHSLEKEIINICKKYDVKINFAVIPYKKNNDSLQALTKQHIEHLINAEKNDWIEVSQHGYAHINHNRHGTPSEFSDESFEQQYNWIYKGKLLLDNLFLNQRRGFVPPWNTFNQVTCSVLNSNDFIFISAGWDIPPNANLSIPVLPRTCQATSLLDSLETTKNFSSLNPIIIAVIHHYDFIESNDKGTFSLSEFENILRSLQAQKQTQLTSLNNIASEQSVFDSVNSSLLHKKWSNLHWRLAKHTPNDCLVNCSNAELFYSLAKNILFKS